LEGGSVVLQVTEAAVSVLRQVIERPEVPQTAIRIQPVQTPAGEAAISFQPVTSPNEGDVEGKAPGLDVFVAPELSDPLDEAVLDARETQEGTELFVRSQAQPG
jgi:Fe-S cluster assembly iron-binding protein IscA